MFRGGDMTAILQSNLVPTLPGSGAADEFGLLKWARLRKDSVPPQFWCSCLAVVAPPVC